MILSTISANLILVDSCIESSVLNNSSALKRSEVSDIITMSNVDHGSIEYVNVWKYVERLIEQLHYKHVHWNFHFNPLISVSVITR